MLTDARYRVKQVRGGFAAYRLAPGQRRWRRIGLYGCNIAPYNLFPSKLLARWFCNHWRKGDERNDTH